MANYSSIVSLWLTQHVAPRNLLAAIAFVWLALWTVIGCRVLGYGVAWKSSALAMAIAITLLSASLIQIWPTSAQRLAVIVRPTAVGSSNTDSQFGEGQTVEVLQQRRDSVRVRTPEGQEVWLPTDAVDVI